jgi:hypothetical protein
MVRKFVSHTKGSYPILNMIIVVVYHSIEVLHFMSTSVLSLDLNQILHHLGLYDFSSSITD